MKTILTYGAFDLFHFGHVNNAIAMLMQLKQHYS